MCAGQCEAHTLKKLVRWRRGAGRGAQVGPRVLRCCGRGGAAVMAIRIKGANALQCAASRRCCGRPAGIDPPAQLAAAWAGTAGVGPPKVGVGTLAWLPGCCACLAVSPSLRVAALLGSGGDALAFAAAAALQRRFIGHSPRVVNEPCVLCCAGPEHRAPAASGGRRRQGGPGGQGGP